MWMEPAIGAALVAAIAGLVAAVLGLVPQLGRLQRLERVVSVLEKIDEQEVREPLIELRDRLSYSLRPRRLPTGLAFVLAIAFFLFSAISVGSGVALRTVWAIESEWSTPLILGGVLLLVGGIVTLVVALLGMRRSRIDWARTMHRRAREAQLDREETRA